MRFVEELTAADIGATFNFYRDGERGALLRERLTAYLHACSRAPLLLVGEAPGYRGTRVSGVPFTSERQLTGSGPAEATATIVHEALRDFGLEEQVLCWNLVPTHPGTAGSNRAPSRAEVAAGRPFLDYLARGRHVIPVGRLAQRELGGPYVRHPSHGGKADFRATLRAWTS